MNIVGVDLGGTQLRAGRLAHIGLGPVTTARVPAGDSAEVVLAALTALIDPLAKGGLDAIAASPSCQSSSTAGPKTKRGPPPR